MTRRQTSFLRCDREPVRFSCYCRGRGVFRLAGVLSPCPACAPSPGEARQRGICGRGRRKVYLNCKSV